MHGSSNIHVSDRRKPSMFKDFAVLLLIRHLSDPAPLQGLMCNASFCSTCWMFGNDLGILSRLDLVSSIA